MKKHLEQQVLQLVDDRQFERYLLFEKNLRESKRPHRLRRFIAIAACFTLLLAALLPLLPRQDGKLRYDERSTLLSNGIDGFLFTSSFEHMVLAGGFTYPKILVSINDAPYTSYRQIDRSGQETVGEKIGELEVTVFRREMITAQDYVDRGHTVITAAVHRVKGMSEDAVILLQYLDGVDGMVSAGGYALFVNPTPPTDRFEDFREAFSLATYGVINPYVRITEPKRDGKNSVELKLTEQGKDRLLSTLVSLEGKGRELTREDGDQWIGDFTRHFSFTLQMSLWSSLERRQLVLLDNGQLLLSWEGRVFLFEVGEEAAEELIDCIETDSEKPKKDGSSQIAQGGVGITEPSP